MIKHLSAPQKTLLLLFIAALSLGAGWGMGKILTAKRTVPSPQVPESGGDAVEEEEGSETEEATPSDWESYSGTITPSGPSVVTQGTYQLVDENGDLIILLEARDDKLVVASGMDATVQGPVEETTEGDQRVMTVEKIIFR